MFNLFKKPINKSDFEAWAKMSDDIAKVAIYLFLIGGRLFRDKAKEN